MIDTYKTIKNTSKGSYKEKGSKFYAFAYPVFSMDEADNRLKELKKEYHDARHHVYAFRLGADMKTHRSSDDGEPSNSSGPPVMGQIRSFGLTNIIVVVVRYFGGTKLGVPGLINAYKTAAREALQNARIVKRTLDNHVTIELEYADVDKVMGTLEKSGLKIIQQEFTAQVKLTFAVPLSQTEAILAKLDKLETVKLVKKE